MGAMPYPSWRDTNRRTTMSFTMWLARRFDFIFNTQDRRFTTIEKQLDRLLKGQRKMSAQLDRLIRETQETQTAVDSVLALVDGLAQQLRDAADDPQKINDLADQLDTLQTKIANAVVANTPAENPPEEPPAA